MRDRIKLQGNSKGVRDEGGKSEKEVMGAEREIREGGERERG